MDRLFSSFRSLILLLCAVTPCLAQTVIRERIVINPSPSRTTHPTVKGLESSHSSTEDLLAKDTNPALRYDQVLTLAPGVIASASVSDFQPGNFTHGAIEIWAHLGSHSFLLEKVERGQCRASNAQVGGGRVVLPTCFSGISVSATSWNPYFATCLSNRITGRLLSVSGSSAVFELKGTFPPFTAQVILSAVRDEAYAPGTVVVTPDRAELVCGGTSWVNVELRDGRGQLYVPCGNSPVAGVARLMAGGDYAYLVGGEGKTLDVGFQGGRASFLVGLDTSKGIIPKGIDVGTIEVVVGGVSGEGRISFRCPYPEPTVTITSPAQDTTIELTARHQPVIELKESHTPRGGQFEPSITWEPSPVINTVEYYEVMQNGDTIEIAVTVKARNIAQMEATDTRVIRVVKKACDGPPCAGEPTVPPIELKEVRGTALKDNPCERELPEGKVLGGVFRPLNEVEEYSIQACFDQTAERWEFSVGAITVKVLLDICEEQLTRAGFRLINSIDEIPEEEACSDEVFSDIGAHFRYGAPIRKNGFLLRPVIVAHEQVHKAQYEGYLRDSRTKFDEEILQLLYKCEEAESMEEAIEKATERVKKLMEDMMTNALRLRQEARSRSDHEERTHADQRVQQLIIDAAEALDRRCK